MVQPARTQSKMTAHGHSASERALKGPRPTPQTPRRAPPPALSPAFRRGAASPGLRHLIEDWVTVCDRLREAQHVALFLDFDGTLVPLQSRPEDVWLEGRTRPVLGRPPRHRRPSPWLTSLPRRTEVL